MTWAQAIRKEAKAEGLEQGREEGRELGLELGRREQATEIARRMVAEGLPVAVIAKTTGLSEVEIERICS